ncbi:PfkB domain-containing protein [Gloeomargarita lithophora Alchichica-D10]|uniref:PfkB domain-containing protein n=1 Tax=Gloeomargarita lithophora Alchichica-D10 TaxID=1188229 RepID=A0A1J0A9W7_9CYAN|nr:carbohydrate kinase [Gloeomargarita lithophora]APB32689.1 PfkB domain-containing protein [Gloeomargarita lithophora Alchichica-D10]
MNHPAVLCFGLALWDALADQIGVARTQVRSWTPYAGGAGLNVACGLGSLGVPVTLIAGVGQDERGTQLLQILQSHQVCTDYIQKLPYPTRLVEVTRSLDGEREFAGFYPADCLDFADGYVAFLEPNFTPKYVYIEALMLAFPQARKTCWQLVDWALEQGSIILVDVNWRPVFWSDQELAKSLTLELLKQVTAVKLTQAEAQWLFGDHGLDILQKKCPNLTHIFLTRGAQGCDYQIEAHRGHCPAFMVNSVDTTGAGDAFVAGWLHQWVTHGETLNCNAKILYQALRWASAVAALSTTAVGAITQAPTLSAVQAFLAAQPPR